MLLANGHHASGPSKEEIEQEKAKLRQEFEEKMIELKQQYQAEQKSNARLQEDLSKLKATYDEAAARVSAGNLEGRAGATTPDGSPTHGAGTAIDSKEALKR